MRLRTSTVFCLEICCVILILHLFTNYIIKYGRHKKIKEHGNYFIDEIEKTGKVIYEKVG